jgi:hypothetical protein
MWPFNKTTREQDAIRWTAANTDFVRALSKEISASLIKSIGEEFKAAANQSSMDLYVWYRKLGVIPIPALQRFEQDHGLTEESIQAILARHHLGDSVKSVSINDVVEKSHLKELENNLEEMGLACERQKKRNDQLEAQLRGMKKEIEGEA